MEITVAGDAFVMTSSITVEQLELLAKHDPDSLKILDEETGNELFAVSYREGKPGIASFGVTFGGKSRGDKDAGRATYTGSIPAGTADAREYVTELIGCKAAVYLKELEASVPKVAEKLAAARKELKDGITGA